MPAGAFFQTNESQKVLKTSLTSRTLELDESFQLMCCTSPELRSASSYGYFTAAKEIRPQCQVLSLHIYIINNE